MDERSDTTTQLQAILDRTNGGDLAARFELIDHAYRRLERLASGKLNGFPRVRRLEETESILHDALLTLERALEKVHPRTVREFFGLSSMHIRWILKGLSRTRRTVSTDNAEPSEVGLEPADDETGPETNFERRELHELVEGLPADCREVVDLLFYQGLQQSVAASLLGVSERTVKRRWRAARLLLQQALLDDHDGSNIDWRDEDQHDAG